MGAGGTGGGNMFGPDYSAPPTDVAPGGGLPQYDTTGQTLGLLGQGLQAGGKSMQRGQTPIPQFQVPNTAGGISYQPYQPTSIPQGQSAGGIDVLQLIQRLLGY